MKLLSLAPHWKYLRRSLLSFNQRPPLSKMKRHTENLGETWEMPYTFVFLDAWDTWEPENLTLSLGHLSQDLWETLPRALAYPHPMRILVQHPVCILVQHPVRILVQHSKGFQSMLLSPVPYHHLTVTQEELWKYMPGHGFSLRFPQIQK